MLMKSTLSIHTVLVGIFVIACVTGPGVASANYTAYGHTFETLEELAEYTKEYNRVYSDLHETRTAPSQTTKTTTTSSAKKYTTLEVRTDNVRTVTTNTAQIAGTVSMHSAKAVRVYFIYGTHSDYLTQYTPYEILDREIPKRTFDSNLRGLTHNTTYYYRAVAVNDSGATAYGTLRSFKTAVDPRIDTAAVRVQTNGVAGVDDENVTLRASIDFRKSSYAKVWFEYGDEENDLYKKTPVAVVYPRSGKVYERLVRGLDEYTRYYVRVVAEDPNGARSYGKTVSFTTRRDVVNEKPKITVGRSTNIGLTGATITGTIDMNDARNGIAFLVYGEDRNVMSTLTKDYSRFKAIRERGDYIQKVLLDDDIDTIETFTETLLYLDTGTSYYYAFGVEYENDEGDDVLLLGSIGTFKTKVK